MVMKVCILVRFTRLRIATLQTAEFVVLCFPLTETQIFFSTEEIEPPKISGKMTGVLDK